VFRFDLFFVAQLLSIFVLLAACSVSPLISGHIAEDCRSIETSISTPPVRSGRANRLVQARGSDRCSAHEVEFANAEELTEFLMQGDVNIERALLNSRSLGVLTNVVATPEVTSIAHLDPRLKFEELIEHSAEEWSTHSTFQVYAYGWLMDIALRTMPGQSVYVQGGDVRVHPVRLPEGWDRAERPNFWPFVERLDVPVARSEQAGEFSLHEFAIDAAARLRRSILGDLYQGSGDLIATCEAERPPLAPDSPFYREFTISNHAEIVIAVDENVLIGPLTENVLTRVLGERWSIQSIDDTTGTFTDIAIIGVVDSVLAQDESVEAIPARWETFGLPSGTRSPFITLSMADPREPRSRCVEGGDYSQETQCGISQFGLGGRGGDSPSWNLNFVQRGFGCVTSRADGWPSTRCLIDNQAFGIYRSPNRRESFPGSAVSRTIQWRALPSYLLHQARFVWLSPEAPRDDGSQAKVVCGVSAHLDPARSDFEVARCLSSVLERRRRATDCTWTALFTTDDWLNFSVR
jgi:hypothetical protein